MNLKNEIKMEKKELKFTLITKRKLVVHFYNSAFKKDFPMSYDVDSETTDEIYQKVLDMIDLEKIKMNEKEKPGDMTIRQTLFSYHVEKWEVMIDNRKIFGHENKESEKFVGKECEEIFVRGDGEPRFLESLLANNFFKQLSEAEKLNLDRFISHDLGLIKDSFSVKDMHLRVMVISDVFGTRFFRKFYKGCSFKNGLIKKVGKIRNFPKFVPANTQKTATWFFAKTAELLMIEKDSVGKTPDEVYNQAVAAEKENIILTENPTQDKPGKMFMYCIRQYESLAYLRSIFGPLDPFRKEDLVEESGKVFVAGKLTNMKDFFVSDDYQKLGLVGGYKFFQFIENNFEVENVTVDFLKSGREDIKFVYITREEGLKFSESIYYKFEEGKDVYKPFDF